MKLLNKYITKNILFPTISIIGILSTIILITQSLKYVNLMVSHGIDGLDFLYVTALLLPSLLFIIIPICLFIAIIYSLNKLNAHREVNILKGVGIDNFSISKPILKISIFVTLLHLFISLYWMPIINHQFKELTKDLKENYITFFLQEKVFAHPTDYLTFYIKNKISTSKFEYVFYQDNSDANKPITLVADEGELVKNNNKMYLNLIKGNRQELNKNGELSVLYFDNLLVQLDFNKHLGSERANTIQETSLYNLIFPDKNLDVRTKNRMFAEATHRITWPLYNIILTMLAISALLYGEYKRSGKTKRIFIFSALAGLVVITNTGLINLGSTYSNVVYLSYIYTFGIFGVLIYFLYFRKIK